MTWRDGTLVSFDTETTGVDPETARIVTAAVVTIDPGHDPDVEDWLVDPGIEIPAGATGVHGVTTEHAREHGRSARSAVGEICRLLADRADKHAPLIVYNAAYDLTLLDRECRRYELPTLHERCADDGLTLWVVDPLVIDRHLDKYRKGKRNLTSTSAYYRVPISEEDAHGATADALCAARVAWKLAGIFPEQLADLDALQAKQAAWQLEWVTHFVEYQRKQGRAVTDASPDWPIRRAKAGVA